MGLDSTAYTLVAPAWTAKKDRMPEPQHTSRTTYRGRGEKKKNTDRILVQHPDILPLVFTSKVFVSYGPDVLREMCHVIQWDFDIPKTCALGGSETLGRSLLPLVTRSSPFPWSRPRSLKWLSGRCWSSESLGGASAAATNSCGTAQKCNVYEVTQL